MQVTISRRNPDAMLLNSHLIFTFGWVNTVVQPLQATHKNYSMDQTMLTYTSNTSRITVYFTYPMHLYLKENLKTNEVLIAYNGMDVTEHLSSIVPEVSDQHDAQSFVNYLYRFGVLSPSDTADDLFTNVLGENISRIQPY